MSLTKCNEKIDFYFITEITHEPRKERVRMSALERS